jgi:hypothetical protein
MRTIGIKGQLSVVAEIDTLLMGFMLPGDNNKNNKIYFLCYASTGSLTVFSENTESRSADVTRPEFNARPVPIISP